VVLLTGKSSVEAWFEERVRPLARFDAGSCEGGRWGSVDDGLDDGALALVEELMEQEGVPGLAILTHDHLPSQGCTHPVLTRTKSISPLPLHPQTSNGESQRTARCPHQSQLRLTTLVHPPITNPTRCMPKRKEGEEGITSTNRIRVKVKVRLRTLILPARVRSMSPCRALTR